MTDEAWTIKAGAPPTGARASKWLYDTGMSEDEVLGTIETQVALLMRLGEATRRSTGVKPHRALDRAAYVILRRLQEDGPQNVSALAAALNLDGSTVTRQVTALQKDGLIERRPDPLDGRGTMIEATGLGLRQVDAVRKARRSLYGTVLRDYSVQEQRELAMTLERFTAALDAHMRATKA
ncbi:MarR family transcriptional regulator [Mycobacterium sp.]|uniref:MarR family winged helix-turn-helix transcriptional regulator n=1 Tax=Mycobacterium sp. TaxID=1785 RepID=UPI00262A6A7C|nr:MarR family transcriptional regulator [Mycobacterium sp.]